MADLMTLCLVPRDIVITAIEGTTRRHYEGTRQSCQQVFHWCGSLVNINPALFNFVVAAYERLKNRGVALGGEAVHEFEVGYRYEEENNLPHLIDGTFVTSAGSMNDLLTDILNTTRS
ncbi:hypothetical protein [Microvirga brassicacearum]|uniref:Uncharacterized protein n=1 Tax=Microvirga brassicacearum TaxID=2580413 RepID=A0A5N3P7Z8_9HYPH|nr:hypothetical protein [Microvirga brassicacearum]KAB0265771.1 hypothetical protein FEZ63_17355 [Microvirga brassicacearum]